MNNDELVFFLLSSFGSLGEGSPFSGDDKEKRNDNMSLRKMLGTLPP